jgi:hypothetical protein
MIRLELLMRPKKREYVWTQMQRLAAAGLGEPDAYSPRRDNFRMPKDHPIARQLTINPGDGAAIRLIRADTGGLLFRGASELYRSRLPAYLLDRAMDSDKGLEYRWTAINDRDIRTLFDVLLEIAGSDPAEIHVEPDVPADPTPVPPSHPIPGGTSMTALETRLRPLLEPVAGQWLRPWMTALPDPSTADVFIVGQNQAKTYAVDVLPSVRYFDSLFNRNGESCRALYDELTGGRASPTRRHIDTLASDLSFARVLESNIVCYSTPRAADLKDMAHADGLLRGARIFPTLLDEIRPKVVILHGAGTISLAERYLRGLPNLAEPRSAEAIKAVRVDLEPFGNRFNTHMIVIPSLSPPKFNQWIGWWPDARRRVATLTRNILGT